MGSGSPSAEVQLALLAQQVAELRGDVSHVLALIEGPPRAESVRGRLHVLETDKAAAKLATAALAEARAERRRAQEERLRSRGSVRAARRWAVATVVSVLVAAYPYVAHFARWG